MTESADVTDSTSTHSLSAVVACVSRYVRPIAMPVVAVSGTLRGFVCDGPAEASSVVFGFVSTAAVGDHSVSSSSDASHGRILTDVTEDGRPSGQSNARDCEA